MSRHRTAQGKTIDMAALMAKNERVRAVGNMPVNARGDSIDSFGNIIKSVNEKVNELNSKTIGNKSAQVRQSATQSKPPKQVLPELTEFEKELEDSINDDIEVEKIKAKEMKK